MYQVKSIFKTIQGEGAHSGRVAVFCRFSGCNLWSGKEQDRISSACQICDTDFHGADGEHGGIYDTAEELADVILQIAKGASVAVMTGGEPLLQMDIDLVSLVARRGLLVHVETNGSVFPKFDARSIDWLCVSPKPGANLRIRKCDELKVLYPHANPQHFSSVSASVRSVQPLHNSQENIQACIQYCMDHPEWRLSIQAQKMVGLR